MKTLIKQGSWLALLFFAALSLLFVIGEWKLNPQMTEAALTARLQEITVPLYNIQKKDGGDAVSVEVCRGVNAAVNDAKDIAFLLTAGHCGSEPLVARIAGTENATLVSVISQGLYGDVDYIIGTKPFCGNAEKAAELPYPIQTSMFWRKGDVFYTLGADGRKDAGGNPLHGLTKLIFVEKQFPNRLVFSLGAPERGKEFSLDCGDKCGYFVQPGVSGSPIIDERGKLVAIANGFDQTSIFEVYGFPLERIRSELRSVVNALGKDYMNEHVCEGNER